MVDKMKPAYDRLAAWVAEDKKNASATPQGAGSLPNGEAYYNAMLNLMTTTEMFLTNAVAGIRPVRALVGHGEWPLGAVTLRLIERLAATGQA
jgi:uncharacterized protein (DUF885 family)